MTFTVLIGTTWFMKNHPTLQKVRDYCDATGLSPVTVSGRATGNPRLWERLLRRLDRDERDLQRLEQYIEGAAPGGKYSAKQHSDQDGAEK